MDVPLVGLVVAPVLVGLVVRSPLVGVGVVVGVVVVGVVVVGVVPVGVELLGVVPVGVALLGVVGELLVLAGGDAGPVVLVAGVPLVLDAGAPVPPLATPVPDALVEDAAGVVEVAGGGVLAEVSDVAPLSVGAVVELEDAAVLELEDAVLMLLLGVAAVDDVDASVAGLVVPGTEDVPEAGIGLWLEAAGADGELMSAELAGAD